MGGRRDGASRQLDVPRSISVRPDHHRTSVSRRGHCHSSGHRFGAHLDSLESAAWSEIRFAVAGARASGLVALDPPHPGVWGLFFLAPLFLFPSPPSSTPYPPP